MSEITAREAGKIVRWWLRDQSIAGIIVTAKTIDFSDLARCSKVFVFLEGAFRVLTAEHWTMLDKLARDHGFLIYHFVYYRGKEA